MPAVATADPMTIPLQGIARGSLTAVVAADPMTIPLQGIARESLTMGLAHPRRPEQQHAGAPLEEAQGAQLGDAPRVELRLEDELEVVEGLVMGQAAEFEATRVAATLEGPDLLLEDEVDELAVAHLRLLGAGDEVVEVLGERGQLQLAGVAPDALT